MPRSKPSRKCPGPNGRCYMCYSRDYRPEEKLTIWDAIVLGCAKSVEIIVTKGSKKGALANNKNSKDGETPLCKAAESGRVDILQVLIKLGADVNKTATYENMTPLHFAAKGGNPAAVEILVSHGANIEARTKEEKDSFHTPLHTAALGCLIGANGEMKQLSCGHLCGHLETVQKLIELGWVFFR